MNKKSYIENITSGIVVALIILPLISILYDRYLGSRVKSFYHVIEAKLPLNPEESKNAPSTKDNEKIKLLKILFRNNSSSALPINELKIYGVKSFSGINYKGKSFNEVGLEKTKMSLLDVGGQLKFINLPQVLPEDEYELFIWAHLYSEDFVEFESNNKLHTASKTYLVAGWEKFFAKYWRLTVFLFAIFSTGIIYRYKAIVREYEKKTKKEN